jgi:hypothetical protein
MTTSPHVTHVCWLLGALGLLFGAALVGDGQTICSKPIPRCLEDVKNLSVCELAELFARAEVGQPPVGRARGRLVALTDERLPRLKVGAANAVWRGKAACADGRFVNRWIGGVRWLGSTYVVGPSWVDGRPAVLIEYAPGTPLFANMHDELREVAPGLYLGPILERCPCPKLRGYLALELEGCKPPKCRSR